jgi:hypothetical protein
MRDLTKLTPGALRALYEKVNAENSRLTSALIDAGRGYEKYSETATKTDDLSKRYVDAADRQFQIRNEMDRRQTYHGSLRRTKNPKRSTLIASLKGALRGAQGSGKARQQVLKARLKRAQTPTARPKGRLPNPKQPKFSLTQIQQIAVDALNVIREPGRRGSGARQAMQKKAVRNWYIKQTRRLGYTDAQIARQFEDVKDIASLERAANMDNPMFDAEAERNAKRVTKIRKVVNRHTGARGEIIGHAGGLVKVKWDDGPTSLTSRSELRLVKKNPGTRRRFTAAERKAIKDYQFASAQEERYLGSVFVTPIRQREYEARTRAAYEAVKRLGLTEAEYMWPMRNPKNPGLLDLAAGVQAVDYLMSKVKGKKNPSITELSKRFQGRVSNAVAEYKAASSVPSDLARIGKLVLLKVSTMRGSLRIPGAMVAATKSEKLAIVGKHAPLVNRKAKPGELLDFGPIDKIVYLTSKAHIGNGKTYEYDHDFEAPKPHLCVDHEGMIVIRGGGYSIRSAGITG